MAEDDADTPLPTSPIGERTPTELLFLLRRPFPPATFRSRGRRPPRSLHPDRRRDRPPQPGGGRLELHHRRRDPGGQARPA
jgi:hypothetical protein